MLLITTANRLTNTLKYMYEPGGSLMHVDIFQNGRFAHVC